jgi:hypothetical protein
MPKRSKRAETFLEQFDLFGHAFELNYKGNRRYRTCFGGLMSVAFVITMSALSAEIVLKIIQSEVKSVSIYNDYINLYDSAGESNQVYFPYMNDFKIAIGFTKKCPLSIGRFQMNQVQRYAGENKVIPIKLEPVQKDWQYFAESRSNYAEHFVTPNQYAVLHAGLQGNLLADIYFYQHIWFERCHDGYVEGVVCDDPETIENFILAEKIHFAWTEQVLNSEFDVRDKDAKLTNNKIDDSNYFLMDGYYNT